VNNYMRMYGLEYVNMEKRFSKGENQVNKKETFGLNNEYFRDSRRI